MTCLRSVGGPLSEYDIPLILVLRNDRRLLRSFLSHYRSFGVTRFICVDDQSDDGTRELLMEQPDVDVWASSFRFRAAARGRLWRQQLAERYGLNRWYLNVDSDEYLIFDNCENRSVRDLISSLENNGRLRLVAPMLDMYPIGDPEAVTFSGDDDTMPWTVANYFDRAGYTLRFKKRAMGVWGGPRERKFGGTNQLIKYPLLYWDRETIFPDSIHQPMPFERNFGSIQGVLLHFKFLSDYREKISVAASSGQYYDGGYEYKKIQAELSKGCNIDLFSDVSSPYIDSTALCDLGFFCRL
jgi:hypothetical protein